MKTTARLALGACSLTLAFALAACGGTEQSADSATTSPVSQQQTTPQASAPTGSAQAERNHNDADTTFAQAMIVHHEGAIEMANLAVRKAESQEVRDLAENIAAAQGPEIEMMTNWLESWGEDTTPMPGMEDHGGMDMDGMSQQEAMNELEDLSGADFDRRFLELMIAHHEGAVAMAEDQLVDGRNPEALQLAGKIIDDQQAEIAEMRRMLEQV